MNASTRPTRGTHWPVRLAMGAGALLLAAGVWFIGPLLIIGQTHLLESTLARTLTLAMLAGLWWCARLLRRRLDRRSEARQTPPRFDFADVVVAVTAVAVATVLFFVGRAYLASRAHIARMDEVAGQLQQQASKLGPQSSLTDIRGLLDPALAATQDGPNDIPALLGIGLDKGPILAAAANQAYRALLNSLLLPQVQQALETQLRDGQRTHLRLNYELLKAYIALADRQSIDSDMAHLLAEVLVRTSPTLNVDARWDALPSHLTAMLSEKPIPPVVLDAELVAGVRHVLARIPRHEIVLQRALASMDRESLAGWTLGSAAGPDAAAAFELGSGGALTDTLVSGQFTPDAYRTVPSRIEASVAQLKAETWVLSDPALPKAEAGKLGDLGLTEAEAERISEAAFREYVGWYIQAWESAIAKIRVRRLPPRQDAVAVVSSLKASPLRLMSEPRDSPMAALARSLADATSPGRRSASGAEEARSRVAEAMARPTPKRWERTYTRVLDNHFEALHRWVQPDDSGHAPVDASLTSMRAAYESLLAQAQGTAPAGSAATPPAAVAQALTDARGLPSPFRDLVLDALSDAQRIVASGLQRPKR